MQQKIVRVIGAIIAALTMMVGASITDKMDWTAFVQLFTGVGGPVVAIGFIGVMWTAWRDGTPIKRPKMLNKVMGGKE